MRKQVQRGPGCKVSDGDDLQTLGDSIPKHHVPRLRRDKKEEGLCVSIEKGATDN